MPELKLNLEYEAQDDLFLQLIYDGYEQTYWCWKEDKRKYNSDPTRFNYILEDIVNSMRVLEAYETLAKHHTARDEHVKVLRAIRERIDYKQKIAEKMSTVSICKG